MAGATELPCLPSPRSPARHHPHWRRRRVCDLELVTWGKADGARHLHRRPTVVKLDKEGLSAADALGHLKENTIRFPPNSSSSSSPSSSFLSFSISHWKGEGEADTGDNQSRQKISPKSHWAMLGYDTGQKNI